MGCLWRPPVRQRTRSLRTALPAARRPSQVSTVPRSGTISRNTHFVFHTTPTRDVVTAALGGVTAPGDRANGFQSEAFHRGAAERSLPSASSQNPSCLFQLLVHAPTLPLRQHARLCTSHPQVALLMPVLSLMLPDALPARPSSAVSHHPRRMQVRSARRGACCWMPTKRRRRRKRSQSKW